MPKPLVWSPKDRIEYTVIMPDGSYGGIGARAVFKDRPGLWNMCWLHSAQVDHLLDWPEEDAENAPGYSTSLSECEASAHVVCGVETLEALAARVKPQTWIDAVVEHNLHPPIRKFWDSCVHNSWLSIVSQRVKLSRYYTEQTGNVISANF